MVLLYMTGRPEFLSETILHHHEPEKAGGNRCRPHLVYVADLISSRFALGCHVNKTGASHLRSSLDVIDFNTGNLRRCRPAHLSTHLLLPAACSGSA